MIRLLKAFVWILAAVALLAVGLFVYLKNADLGAYEEQIEAYLSRAIGHEVEVEGSLELHFGNLTRLTAEQITISNADWQPEPRLLSADRLSVTVRVWSLISSPIVIENFEVRGLDVRVERNTEAESNWQSSPSGKAAAPREEFDPDLIAFRQARLQDVQFTLVDPARPRPLNVSLDRLNIDPGEDDMLSLDLAGTIGEFPLATRGQAGPWQNLLDGTALDLDLDVTLGRVRLKMDGSIGDPAALDDVKLALDLEGPAIDRVTDVLGLPKFAEGAFKLEGNIEKTDDDHQIRMIGNLGAVDIHTSGHVDRLIKPQRAQIHFDYSGPDAKHVAEMFGVEGVPDASFKLSGDATQAGHRFEFSETVAQIGDNQITVNGWIDATNKVPDGDIQIAASGPDMSVFGPFVKISGVPAQAFSVGGRIRKDAASVRFDNLKIDVGENRITADGAFEGRGSNQNEIAFEASGPDISILQPMTGLRGIPRKPYTISAQVRRDEAGLKLQDAVGVFGDNRIAANGVVGLQGGLAGTDVRVRASGSELLNVALLARAPYLPAGPFKAAARVQIGSDNLLTLTQASADTAGFSATGKGTVGIRARSGQVNLDVSATSSDLAGLLQFEFLDRFAGESLEIEGGISHKAGVFGLRSVQASIGSMKADVDGTVTRGGTAADLDLKVSAPDTRVLAEISGYGNLPDGAVSIDGRVRKTPGHYELDQVEVRIGDNRLTADGILSNEPLKNDSDLRFSVAGPDVTQLGLPFGIAALPAKPFSVSGEVNGIPTGFAIEKLDAKLDDSTLTGRFAADLRGKPAISGVLSSSLIDATSEVKEAIEEEEEAGGEEPEQAGSEKGNLVFSDKPFEVDWLQSIDLDVDVSIDRLLVTTLAFHDIRTSVDLDDGVLDIEHVSAHAEGGKLTGKVHFEPTAEAYELDGLIELENLRMSFVDFETHDRSALPPLSGQIKIRGSGNSPHDMAASSNGVVDLKQGAGRTRDLAFLRRLRGLLAKVAKPDDPLLAKRQFVPLECAFYHATITDGTATIERLAMQTGTVTVVAAGTVDLGTEELDVSLQIKQRKGIGITLTGVANSFMKLGGTLLSPSLRLDPTGSAKTTGAAVATGGLSLLAKGLWDRVSSESGICDAKDEK